MCSIQLENKTLFRYTANVAVQCKDNFSDNGTRYGIHSYSKASAEKKMFHTLKTRINHIAIQVRDKLKSPALCFNYHPIKS